MDITRQLAEERDKTQEDARRRREVGGGQMFPYLEHVFSDDGGPLHAADGRYITQPTAGATMQHLFSAVVFTGLIAAGMDADEAASKAVEGSEALVMAWKRKE